jgi:hypothetical protein
VLNIVKHDKAAPYQGDKAQIKTRPVWFQRLPQRRGIEMKENCRKTLAALVMVLAFSSAAFADDGVMWPMIAPPPPPPATTAAGTASTDGSMQTGFTSTDSVTEAALTVIQIVLSLP